ncbi:hypothetical protein PSHT_07887 [Puccinia striiformis]|uniref:Uncharacterized protein n=2 Tax=Puccinia striiformis TaxID=27350 RepID=A0A2S4VUD6_9BASI|nr:hypothetical protein PSTT_08576 [Puccinia striiformis]POW13109.1 hypothetical protein PSHT_07887 [Puccinia striiformis]
MPAGVIAVLNDNVLGYQKYLEAQKKSSIERKFHPGSNPR